MIEEKRVLALIPARGGSKGIKDKNIYEIDELPLIAYTIRAAKQCDYVDDIVISTDSEKIAGVAREYGALVPFYRPAELASDTATTLDAVRHAITTLSAMGRDYDILMILQPTSPLRDAADIKGALEVFMAAGQKGLAAVSPVDQSPILIRTIAPEHHMEKLLNLSSTVRRQDMPDYYFVNGSIYINAVKDIDENTSFNDNEVPYVMERSHSVDIDEYKDIEEVKWYLSQKKNKN
ncbi:MAG: acylneuraminate cytidylyltransferase family protein [Lachnospiraceae bacterium]|nr:acylneuraminate cytidylyltransferase family protein [Lachnospiraceae bacterium]